MFVELIEHLRCPRAHDETALVAAASRSANRLIVDGVLGCPVCNAEFRIEGGVTTIGASVRAAAEPPSPEVAMRLAAFLNLTDPRGFALLGGRWASHVRPLGEMVDTPLVLLDPPGDIDVAGASAIIRCGGSLPFAAGSARALAWDPEVASPAAIAVLQGDGRVVAPASAPVPEGVEEIARDERDWVGRARGHPAPALVPLRRAK